MNRIRQILSYLALAAFVGCASDVWFKPGAGADLLAKDKASCREETALPGEDALSAFERCMEARDWWHVVPGSGRAVSLREDQVVSSDELPEVSAGATTETPAEGSTPSSSSVTSGPRGGTSTRRQAAPTPARADPNKRQLWFKFGAGAGQLARDQSECRVALGLAANADSPSRWGEDPEFDTCMRDAGWMGGNVEGS